MGLERLHLLLHALKGCHRAIGVQAPDGSLQLSLGLGCLGPGLEHVFFGACFGDLAFQGQKILFQGFNLTALGIELTV